MFGFRANKNLKKGAADGPPSDTKDMDGTAAQADAVTETIETPAASQADAMPSVTTKTAETPGATMETDNLTKRTSRIAKRAGEMTRQAGEIARQTEEMARGTEEIAKRVDEARDTIQRETDGVNAEDGATNDDDAGSIATEAKPAEDAEHKPACEYCGKPVDAGANKSEDKHDICRREYRLREKNSLCVYCGTKHSSRRGQCSTYENYGKVRLVIKKCEYCDKQVNPKLNKDSGQHDECHDEYMRRMDNNLCRKCGEEVLDPKAEGSKRNHRKCEQYEGFKARDQRIDELLNGSQTNETLTASNTAGAPSGASAAAGTEPKPEIKPICFDSVGGLDREIAKLREVVELPLLHPELFKNAGVRPPRGVLLYGPSGTGKTLLASTLATQSGVYFRYVEAPSLQATWVGLTEKWTRDIFNEAKDNAPAIIFIDEIDSLGGNRLNADRNYQINETEQLLSSMDGLASSQVVVIGATNRPHALDPAFRRPGRFDVEIEIGMPDERGRHDILKIHTSDMPLSRVDLKKIARLTHGFAGADIMAVAKAAAMSAIRRTVRHGADGPALPEDRNVSVTGRDFEKAIEAVGPSILRGAQGAIPDVGWDDIGGLDSVKSTIIEDIEWPRKYSKEYARMGIRASRGILLHGPPGTGKTMIAKAVANSMDSNFITVGCPELISKYPGETERNIRRLFDKARRARPCVIFLDEIDALLPEKRDGIENNRIVSQILIELDGVAKSDGVILVGATNRPDMIDPAAMRPGRFDKILEIKPPDEEGRKSILEVHIGKRPRGDMDFERLAAMTDGFTGADIAHAVNAASVLLLRRCIEANGQMKDVKLTHEAMEESILAVRRQRNMPAPSYVFGP